MIAAAGVVAGALLGVLFVRRQRRLADPMIDVSLFRHRAFSGSVLTNMLGVFALVGLLFLVPQYLQLVLGLTPMTAALWLLPTTVAGSPVPSPRPGWPVGFRWRISSRAGCCSARPGSRCWWRSTSTTDSRCS
ncbi:major facilitator superfamily protein [Saccharomonospora azurea SZMC 14600]|nr:major facilitator superfamily protein [Saccharomonospora azurea SZMC 14600]